MWGGQFFDGFWWNLLLFSMMKEHNPSKVIFMSQDLWGFNYKSPWYHTNNPNYENNGLNLSRCYIMVYIYNKMLFFQIQVRPWDWSISRWKCWQRRKVRWFVSLPLNYVLFFKLVEILKTTKRYSIRWYFIA